MKKEILEHLSQSLREKVIFKKKVDSGSRRENYLISTTSGKKYFVKIWSTKQEKTLAKEWKNLDNYLEWFSPKPISYSLFHGYEILITEYVQEEKYSDVYIHALGELLSKLNKKSSSKVFRGKKFVQELKDIYSLHIGKNQVPKTNIDIIFFFLGSFYKKFLQEGEKLYLTHGDLHVGNIITTHNRIVLVDWESYGSRIREVDMLSSIYNHKFNLRQVNILLSSYHYDSTNENLERLKYIYIYVVFKNLPYNKFTSQDEYQREVKYLCKIISKDITFFEVINLYNSNLRHT